MYPKKRRTTRLTLIAVLCAAFVAMGVMWLAGAGTALAEDPTPLSGSVKTASPEAVSPGSKVAYTVVLSNSSMISATGQVVVGDMLDPALSYVPSSARVYPDGIGASWLTNNPPYITFTVPSIAINSVVTLAFQVEVTTAAQMGDVISNTALIHFESSILERTALIEVAATPISKIMSPWNKQLITERGNFVVSGRTWTADQSPEFPNPPVIQQPIIYVPQTGGGYYFVQWSAVAGGLSYELQEAPDDTFSEITSYTLGSGVTNRLFTNQAPGQYFYRIQVLNSLGSSFWSDVASVVVPTSNLALEVDALMSPAAPVASYQPVVEVNIKQVGGLDNWLPATSVTLDGFGDWWNWTYTWPLPTENDGQQYVVQTRAKDLVGNYDPAMIDTVTVTVKNGLRFVYFPLIVRYYPPIPYAPTLNIASNDGKGNYSLSWVYGYSNFIPTSYHFQEATDAAFTNLTIDSTRTSPQTFTNQTPGTYYYRVQGVNSYGAGAWSNTQMISVVSQGFFDDFSNSNSGWRKKIDNNTLETAYEAGFYKMKILLDLNSANNKKMGIVNAPYNNTAQKYDVEVVHRFVRAGDQTLDPYGGKAGLIFGATSDFSTIFVFEWNFQGQCAIGKYTNVGIPYVSVADLRYWTRYKDWSACGTTLHVGFNGTPNHAKVEVNGNTARILMNGGEVMSITSADLSNNHNVGLITGSWDLTPVKSYFDNFRVTPK